MGLQVPGSDGNDRLEEQQSSGQARMEHLLPETLGEGREEGNSGTWSPGEAIRQHNRAQCVTVGIQPDLTAAP